MDRTRARGHYLRYRPGPDEQLLFEILHDPAGDSRVLWVGALLAVLVTALLTGVYFWIRRTMAPLKQLSRGAEEFGAGSLDHRIVVNRGDELGDLARAFNSMADRLRQLLGAKERMLRDVSHELRSPLTRMKIALEMAPAGAVNDSLKEDILEMERMATAILDSARTQSGTDSLMIERCDLISLVEEVVSSHEREPPGVLFDGSPEKVLIPIDRVKVKTVLRNVIDNGLKYSSQDSGPVKVRVIERGDRVTVEVEDQGIGISAADLPFIGEPFYRVDPSRSRESGGFGLGLSLCKAIMAAHGGSIAVKSSVGKGTTVSLTFPVAV